jgi:hypothetical protein
MSPPRAKTDAERSQYLAQVLRQNPLRNAPDILEARNRFRGVTANGATANSGVDLYERREEAARAIAELREEFWSLDLNTLSRRLKGLELGKFPDLQNAARRMSVVAGIRAKLPKLTADSNFDGAFFSHLKSIWVVSPRDAAPIKDQVMRDFEKPAKLRKAQAMIGMLENELPEVYALDEDWLDMILRLRPKDLQRPEKKEAASGVTFEGWGWAIWVVVWIVIQVLRHSVRH